MGYREKCIFIILNVSCLVLTACSSQSPNVTNPPTNTPVMPTIIPSMESTPSSATASTSTSTLLSKCPEGDIRLVPDFTEAVSSEFPRLEKPILDFLNRGGTAQAVINALEWTEQQDLIPDRSYDSSIVSKEEFNKTHLFTQDLTEDGIPELIVSRVNLYIFGCKENQYQTLLAVENNGWINNAAAPWIVNIEDMNLNNIPEIIVKSYFLNTWILFRVFEWNSNEFKSLLVPLRNTMYSDMASDGFTIQMGEALLRDTNDDRTIELILRGYDPFPIGSPSRGEQYTYKWNGEAYIFSSKEFSPPVYRFQAVQDADRFSLEGNYERALMSYQDAILAEPLEWWSDERSRYETNCKGTETNCPFFPNTPTPDESEYFNLAAYSYFRVMMIHLIQGDIEKAAFFFNYLQIEFPPGKTGSAYAEMAKEFWDEYQTSKNITQACCKAIVYATNHPIEVLSYLGNGEFATAYYGEQSLVYTPQDVCPFN